MVDGLANRLQRSVAIDDRQIRLIVASRHFGDEDAVRVQSVLGRGVDNVIRDHMLSLGIDHETTPRHIPPIPELGQKARLCVPVRYNHVLLGYMWLIEESPLTGQEVEAAQAVAESVALLLYKTDLAFERRQAAADATLRDLLSSDPSARAAAVAEIQEEDLLRDLSCVRVLRAHITPNADDDTEPEALEATVLQVCRRLLAMLPEGHALVQAHRRQLTLLVTGSLETRDHQMREYAEMVLGQLSQGSGTRCVAGIGVAQHALRDAYLSHEQARTAQRTALILPALGDILGWEDLGVFALLAKLSPNDVNVAAYPPPLLRLAADRNAATLLGTVETYLDLAGDAQATSQALHVHRATLYQRLSRIEDITGLTLRDGTDRLTLHLGIKLARLTGQYGDLLGTVAP